MWLLSGVWYSCSIYQANYNTRKIMKPKPRSKTYIHMQIVSDSSVTTQFKYLSWRIWMSLILQIIVLPLITKCLKMFWQIPVTNQYITLCSKSFPWDYWMKRLIQCIFNVTSSPYISTDTLCPIAKYFVPSTICCYGSQYNLTTWQDSIINSL